jgi:hypothetical protein
MKLKEVDHLCKVITGRQTKKCCLGFTLDDQTMLRGAYNVSNGRAGPTTDLIVEDSITLEQLLLYKIRPPAPTTRDDANQLVMAERLALAANLASSLLQLHETPWLNSIWTKKDIHFVRTYQQPSAGRLVRAYRPVDAKQPFVSHDFVVRHDIAHAPNADESVPPPVHGNFSLLALGIILLELYFNEPIENKRLPEDLTDGKVNSSTDMNVATRWLQEVWQRKISDRYWTAVKHCIVCFFDPMPKSTDLEDRDFREAVYQKVVLPLEQEFHEFTRT